MSPPPTPTRTLGTKDVWNLGSAATAVTFHKESKWTYMRFGLIFSIHLKKKTIVNIHALNVFKWKTYSENMKVWMNVSGAEVIISMSRKWRSQFQLSKHNGIYFYFCHSLIDHGKVLFYSVVFFMNRSQSKLLRRGPENMGWPCSTVVLCSPYPSWLLSLSVKCR